MTWSHASEEMWSLKLLTFLLFFSSDSLLGMLSHTAGGSLTFFWTEGRKKRSLVAENTQFVRACVLLEIDVMALMGGIWGGKLEVFDGGPVLGPTGGLEVGRCSREGREGVGKVENTDCVRASPPLHICRFSVPPRETCVRCF